MMPDGWRALGLLGRGHGLYAGGPAAEVPVDTAAALTGYADRLAEQARWPGVGPAGTRSSDRGASLRRMAVTDAGLSSLMARAGAERGRGWNATRAVLADARADRLPGVDTALGQREALRRTVARLRRQRRIILRSRRSSRRLAARARRLAYRPHRGRTAAGIPAATVRYDRVVRAGSVGRRIAAALDRLGITDPAARHRWVLGYQTLIARESAGNPGAIAADAAIAPGPLQADGHRLGYARGLAQVLPATFARYHQPGTSSNIYDPVANICASMNYVMHRYGVHPDGTNLVALVQQADARRAPEGY